MKTRLTVRDESRVGEIDKIADSWPGPTARLWSKSPWVDHNPVLAQSGESPKWQVITVQNLRVVHFSFLVNS